MRQVMCTQSTRSATTLSIAATTRSGPLVVKSVNGIVTIPVNGPLVEAQNIFEVHNTGTQTEDLNSHGFREEFERIDDDLIIEQSVSSDEQIIVQEEIMESNMEAFIEGMLQETDIVCPVCDGTGRDYFHDDCALRGHRQAPGIR